MWGQIVYAVVMMVVSEIIRSATERPPENATPGRMDVPTAENGGTISVLFGTDVIADMNVVWYGDSATAPIYA